MMFISILSLEFRHFSVICIALGWGRASSWLILIGLKDLKKKAKLILKK